MGTSATPVLPVVMSLTVLAETPNSAASSAWVTPPDAVVVPPPDVADLRVGELAPSGGGEQVLVVVADRPLDELAAISELDSVRFEPAGAWRTRVTRVPRSGPAALAARLACRSLRYSLPGHSSDCLWRARTLGHAG
jgi:hypothetical protein